MNAGAVHVLYGGPQGLRGEGSQRFVLGSGGVPLSPEPRDFFGLALAAGDFDADGNADLAVGVPYKDLGVGPARASDEGIVLVFRGSAGGLSYSRAFANQTAGNGGNCRCTFGRQLAAGDFNDDDRADLAIGTAGYISSAGDTEGVYVLYGASGEGLRIVGRTAISGGGEFSALGTTLRDVVLAAGDHDGDGFDDLAIGSPTTMARGTVIPKREEGVVIVLPGSPQGVKTDPMATYDEGRASGGSRNEFDRFGTALVFGDFRGDGREQLVVGMPFDDRGSKADAGAVAIFTFERNPGAFETLGRLWSQADLPNARVDAGIDSATRSRSATSPATVATTS